MNNPFAADRNIFTNIPRPARVANPTQPINKPNNPISGEQTNPKVDLNFRGEFRNMKGEPGNYGSLGSGESLGSVGGYGNRGGSREMGQGQPASMGQPGSMSQQGGMGLAGRPFGVSVPAQGASQHGIGSVAGMGSMHYSSSSRTDFSRPSDLPRHSEHPIQRQKITFGIPQGPPSSALHYDRASFINRPQFLPSSSSNSQVQPPPINLSPIQQKSKHALNNQSFNRSFMDIDNEDLSKILASSKNQQQLCRLLGIEVPRRAGGLTVSDRQQVDRGQFLKKYNTTGLVQTPVPYSQPRHNQQVFNYESQPPSNTLKTRPPQPQYLDAPITNSRTIKQPSSFQPAQEASDRYPAPTGAVGGDLESAIAGEMRKQSTKGKYRVFLSAGERLEMVKYNMEVI